VTDPGRHLGSKSPTDDDSTADIRELGMGLDPGDDAGRQRRGGQVEYAGTDAGRGQRVFVLAAVALPMAQLWVK
jgi:hypothetical protein